MLRSFIILMAFIEAPKAVAASKNDGSRLAFLANTLAYSAEINTPNVEAVNATGTGFGIGVEISTKPLKSIRKWILAFNYSSNKINLSPNSTPESINIQSVQLMALWGLSVEPFLIAAGAAAKYEFDNILRNSNGNSTKISHSDYGISNMQYSVVALTRFNVKYGRSFNLFLDLKYFFGLADRALGVKDTGEKKNLVES